MKYTIVIFFFFLIQITFGQGSNDDWPSSSNYFTSSDNKTFKQIYTSIELKEGKVMDIKKGKEYYYNGNLHAEGSLIIKDIICIVESNKKIKDTEYVRNGLWNVYFDSSLKITRSAGNYKNGCLHGYWTIYSIEGSPIYIYEFKQGIVKKKIEIDGEGNKMILISRSDKELFVKKYTIWLIVLCVLPIALFRVIWNILTYNKIYNTMYIPLLQNWQKGGFKANVYSTVVFWWAVNNNDDNVVKKYKKIANWISVLSIVWVVIITILLIIE